MAKQLKRVLRVREVWVQIPVRPNLILRCLGAMTWRWTPQTRYTLRRNTASILKGFGMIPKIVSEK